MPISEIKYSRTESFLFVLIAYALAIGIPWIMLPYLVGIHDLVRVGLLDVFATLIVFVFSYRLKNSSMYDPYWSVIPIPISIYFMTLFPEGNLARQILLIALVAFWGIRLTFNWVRSWPGLHHEDWRYVDLQKENGRLYWLVSFSGIHLLPTLLVYFGLIPIYYAMQITIPINIVDIGAALITFLAVVIELISDEQLRKFRKLQDFKAGAIIEKGLWKVSRHPNYFGEVAFWVGISLFGLNLNLTELWWIYSGALAMIMLFVFISIPMMEKRSLELRPGFKMYMKRVSMLIPWFPKSFK